MPVDMSRYPANWKQISQRIRFERAGNKCEWCGVPNHTWIARKRGTKDYLLDNLNTDGMYCWPNGDPIRLSELPEGYDYDKPTYVILTVAHLGTEHQDGRKGDKHDKMDVREENLAALCQRCHLLYDIDDHVAHARETRLHKKQKAIANTGQQSLFEEK